MPKDRHATVSPSPLEAISSGDPREGPPKTEEPVHATHLASPDNVFSSTRSGQARSAESAGTLTALGLEEDRSASAPSIKQTMPKEIVEMSRGESQQVPNADSIRLTEGARSAQRANNSSSANCRQNASDTWDGVEIRCGEEGCREDDIARRRDAAINCSSDLESIGGIGESPEATHNRDEHDEVTTNTNIRPAEVEPPPPQELIRLRQVVLQRERQLMTAMTENASLNDSVNLLKVQLESFETLAAEERAIVETLLRETTQKLADKEVQFTEAIKARHTFVISLNPDS
ncbi:hypothetical protein DFJ73DRAFT_237768 [Zopfochytrium polystomum]|nr:hypothetical protein DFJ73DRAFT_237768 [Zopfochytrium polystomum]